MADGAQLCCLLRVDTKSWVGVQLNISRFVHVAFRLKPTICGLFLYALQLVLANRLCSVHVWLKYLHDLRPTLHGRVETQKLSCKVKYFNWSHTVCSKILFIIIIIIIIVYRPFSMLRTGWTFSPNQASRTRSLQCPLTIYFWQTKFPSNILQHFEPRTVPFRPPRSTLTPQTGRVGLGGA